MRFGVGDRRPMLELCASSLAPLGVANASGGTEGDDFSGWAACPPMTGSFGAHPLSAPSLPPLPSSVERARQVRPFLSTLLVPARFTVPSDVA